jgi:hypothetical protein
MNSVIARSVCDWIGWSIAPLLFLTSVVSRVRTALCHGNWVMSLPFRILGCVCQLTACMLTTFIGVALCKLMYGAACVMLCIGSDLVLSSRGANSLADFIGRFYTLP